MPECYVCGSIMTHDERWCSTECKYIDYLVSACGYTTEKEVLAHINERLLPLMKRTQYLMVNQR